MGPRAKTILVPLVASSIGLGAASCSNVLGIEETSLEVEPPEGRDWRCVGHVEEPTQSQPIQIQVKVTDFSLTALPGLQVIACGHASDTQCNVPVASAVSDADGYATLDIPQTAVPFTGYLRLEGGSDRVPYISYYSRPIDETLEDPIPFLSVTWEDLDNGAIPNSATIDGRGHLYINATDCQNVNAPGVSFVFGSTEMLDDQSVPFYTTTSGFSDQATETVGGPAIGGQGGVFNLLASDPPRSMHFEAISEDTGEVFAAADWLIFPDTLTTGRLLPQ